MYSHSHIIKQNTIESNDLHVKKSYFKMAKCVENLCYMTGMKAMGF